VIERDRAGPDRGDGKRWSGLDWALGATVLGGLGGLIAVAVGRIAGRTQRREPQAQAA